MSARSSTRVPPAPTVSTCPIVGSWRTDSSNSATISVTCSSTRTGLPPSPSRATARASSSLVEMPVATPPKMLLWSGPTILATTGKRR